MKSSSSSADRRLTPARLALLTALLLLVFAGRIGRLDVDAAEVRVDEVWSIWQTLGSPADILHWTPYDWPPLYYLALGGWRALVGLHPVALRLLSVLAFLVGASAIYRAARRLDGFTEGALSLVAYGAAGLMIFLSTELRGYALLLAFVPLALWLTLRYFARPTFRRALPLALALAAGFYTSFTSVGAFAVIGLFTLIVYGRRVVLWWLPGLLAFALVLPEVLDKARLVTSRVSATGTLVLPPPGEALVAFYAGSVGPGALIWLALALVALVAVVRRGPRRADLALLAWSALPLLLYALNPVLGFFAPRYSWWVTPGLALWLGVGLARTPRPLAAVAGLLLAALLFVALPLSEYQIAGPPVGKTWRWLRDQARWGDVVLMDPNYPSAGAGWETFDYFTRVYFPQGLAFVSDPDGYRRVWYLSDSHPDPATEAAVQQGRVEGRFFGPPRSLLRLYEGPPSAEGIPFANGMRFHGADFHRDGPLVWHENETVAVTLWWTAEPPVTLDYSVGLHLYRDDGQLVAQNDSGPQVAGAPTETSRWETGRFYRDERALALPLNARAGRYRLALVVYGPDGARVSAPGQDESGVLPLATMDIQAW